MTLTFHGEGGGKNKKQRAREENGSCVHFLVSIPSKGPDHPFIPYTRHGRHTVTMPLHFDHLPIW